MVRGEAYRLQPRILAAGARATVTTLWRGRRLTADFMQLFLPSPGAGESKPRRCAPPSWLHPLRQRSRSPNTGPHSCSTAKAAPLSSASSWM
jgi:hypothetical protein